MTACIVLYDDPVVILEALQEESSNDTGKQGYADTLSAADSTADWGNGSVAGRGWGRSTRSSSGRGNAVGLSAAASRARGRSSGNRVDGSGRRLHGRSVDRGRGRRVSGSRAVARHGVSRDRRGSRRRVGSRGGSRSGSSGASGRRLSRRSAVGRGRVGRGRGNTASRAGRGRSSVSRSRLGAQGHDGRVGRHRSSVGRGGGRRRGVGRRGGSRRGAGSLGLGRLDRADGGGLGDDNRGDRGVVAVGGAVGDRGGTADDGVHGGDADGARSPDLRSLVGLAVIAARVNPVPVAGGFVVAGINHNTVMRRMPDVHMTGGRARGGLVCISFGERKTLGQVKVEANTEVDEIANVDIDAQVKQALTSNGGDSRGSEDERLHCG